MKIFLVNKSFPGDPKYGGKEINNASPAFIPRVGDHVDMGYKPLAKVVEVAWFYEENRVTVVVE